MNKKRGVLIVDEHYQYQPEEKKSNGVSIAALVCGLLSLCCCNPMYLVSLAAIVLGIVGISQKNSSNKGMAITGLVLGSLAIVVSIIVDIILLPFTLGTSFFF